MSKKLAAGQPGTKKMMEHFGDKLLCVRYRYDPDKKIRYKTVEIIVEKGFWIPGLTQKREGKKVGIKVWYREGDIRAKVKAAGGIWNVEKNIWELEYKAVKKLGLTERIIDKI